MNRVISKAIPLLKGPKFGGGARLLNVHEYVSINSNEFSLYSILNEQATSLPIFQFKLITIHKNI